jgi:oligopeptide transport system ATP-binding protein
MSDTTLLQTKALTKYFPISRPLLFRRRSDVLKALDGVDLGIAPGETLGLVGESGCGKTTLGRLILGLETPTAGEVFYAGQSLAGLKKNDRKRLRKEVQMIFQNPFSSLNPRVRVGRIVEAPLVNFSDLSGRERQRRVGELFELVGLDPAFASRFPHEFSGGQRQRIVIARALASGPKLVVADEPVSALDVSIQAQIINLLSDLQAKLGLTFLFITHDLRIVRHISDRVAVMYLGKIFEIAQTEELFCRPLHPYTQKLLAAIPVPDPDLEDRKEVSRMLLSGEVPGAVNVPRGCRFHTRCDQALEECPSEEPQLLPAGGGHQVACHLLNRLLASSPTAAGVGSPRGRP